MSNVKHCVLIGCLCLSMGVCVASAQSKADLYAGLLKDEDSHRWVLELGGHLPITDNFFGSMSAFMFEKDDKVFSGLGAGFNAGIGDQVMPYLGLGIYAAQHKACLYEDTPYEDCEYDVAAGIYPELGVKVHVGDFLLGANARYYKSFNGGENEFGYTGVFFGIRF